MVQNRIDRVIVELPKFCESFLTYCNLRLSKLTACGYLYAIRQFFDFYCRQKNVAVTEFKIADLDKVTTNDIEEWLVSYTGKIDNNTIIYKYSVIKTFMGYYYTRREIQRNAADQIIMPHLSEKPIIRLCPDEVTRLLATVTPIQRYYLRDLTILIFFLSTGVRVSELVGLDIKHIDIENGSFVVTRKGGKVETQYMTEDLQIQLLIYLDSIKSAADDIPLFPSRDNPRISDNAIRLLVEKYITLAGIKKKISPHKLRSTFGTNLYRKTRDIFAVAQCLGHASVNTTRKYYAAMDEDIKREAVRNFRIA